MVAVGKRDDSKKLNRKQKRKMQFKRSNSEERIRPAVSMDKQTKIAEKAIEKVYKPCEEIMELQEKFLQGAESQLEILNKIHQRIVLEANHERNTTLKQIIKSTKKKEKIIFQQMFVNFNKCVYKGENFQETDNRIIEGLKSIIHQYNKTN